jgi:hypothetical protein
MGCLRQSLQPCGILRLQGDELADRRVPALHPAGAAWPGWPLVTRRRWRRRQVVPGPVARPRLRRGRLWRSAPVNACSPCGLRPMSGFLLYSVT